ncbi:DUF4209 domain-containing protein [Oerskovia jenensis]|uniref:DUF4209 domain-containing protein n=1 Tax=Oerskovia jenensis TaxID=162169 RepID=UPI0036DE611F
MTNEDTGQDATSFYDASWFPSDLDPWESPEALSGRLQSAAKEAPVESRQQGVLEALALVTSAMLNPDDWNDPFTPAIQWGGKRSALPQDATTEQRALLAQVLPSLTHLPTRARVADVLWTYGDRRNSDVLFDAIDTYRVTPWATDVWPGYGADAWRRALLLTERRGSAGAARMMEMGDVLRERLLVGTVDDAFMLVRISELLRDFVRLAPADARQLAEHLGGVAAEASLMNRRLARHLHEQSSAWYQRSGDTDNTHAALVSVANLYVADADEREQEEGGGALAASMHLESALKVLRQLPRRFRASCDLDARIKDLQSRLRRSRLSSLEQMQHFESDPVDLAEAANDARSKVSGLDSLASLACLAQVAYRFSLERARVSARERLSGSVARVIAQRQVLTHDGRRVARVPGGTGEPTDAEVMSEALREYQIHVGISVSGRIIPALDVATLEHRFDVAAIAILCHESPMIPSAHEDLWARALHHGLNSDFPSAVAILAPQVEQFVRLHLQAAGTHTLFTDPATGNESEKGLGSLLEMDEAKMVFGEDLVFELRGLLTEQEGFNLRNDVAHGLLNDAGGWSSASVYLWALCLRFVVFPVWRARGQDVKQSDPDFRDSGDDLGSG